MPGQFADTAPLLAGDAKNAAAPAAPTPPPSDATKPPPVPFDPKAGAQKLATLFSQPIDPDTGNVKVKPAEEPAKVETPPKVEKPIRVAKKPAPEPEKRPTPPKVEAKKPEPAPAPAKEIAAVTEEEDDATFEKTLAEEEQVLLEQSRDAERLMADKYAGQSGKMSKFLREAAKKEKDIESGDITEAKYREWYAANLPKVGALDRVKIDRARATEDAKKEFEPKLEEERHSRWAETERPKVAERAAKVRGEIWAGALPDSVTQVVAERLKDVQNPAKRAEIITAAQKEFSLELEIATNITNAAREDIEEFYSLTTKNVTTGKPLKALRAEAEVFDAASGQYVPNLSHPDPEVRKQAGVLAMISDIDEEFKNTGGLELKKDGKWFATRKEYAHMPADQRVNWWIFSDDDIVKRAQGRVKGVVAATIDQHVKQLEARGFKRAGAAAPAAPAEPAKAPAPGAPPAPRISPPPAGNAAILTPAQLQARSLAAKMESQPLE